VDINIEQGVQEGLVPSGSVANGGGWEDSALIRSSLGRIKEET
jgi:hypothetical protein